MSLLSDLNNKIKALSTRVGTEVKSLWSGVNTAQSTATAAQTTANTANSTANTAKSTADTANSTANTALSTANAKVSKSGDTMTGLLTNSSGYVAGLSGTAAQYRAVNGDYGFLIRNDGTNTYFLLTAAGDPNGSWDTNSVKLFRINHAELKVMMPDGAWLGNGKIWVA